MANWFANMTTGERRTFWACFTGWAVDAMDVQLYAVAMPALIAYLNMSKGQAGMVGISALLFSSLGGWLSGILADRIGRARVLRLCILWFATFTFLSGLTHSFVQLVAARSLQGLGFGGEWAVGAVLIGEVINKNVRGRAVASVQSGWSVGYGAAVLAYMLVFSFIPAALAWRVLFFIGLLPALVALWISRGVEEPQLFRQMKKEVVGSGNPNFLEIFHPSLIRNTLLASLLAAGALGGNYIILTWLPTYLKSVRN